VKERLVQDIRAEAEACGSCLKRNATVQQAINPIRHGSQATVVLIFQLEESLQQPKASISAGGNIIAASSKSDMLEGPARFRWISLVDRP
jgi:hypothetical protein